MAKISVLPQILFIVLILWEPMGCASMGRPEPVEDFSELVDRLLQLPTWQRADYWTEEKGQLLARGSILPETRGQAVLFLLESPKSRRVTIYGDLNRWASPGTEMIPIPGTDVFYIRISLDTQSRLKYRFLPDGKETQGIPDPWNPKSEITGRRTDSILEMPDYSSPETRESSVPKGKLELISGPESWFRSPAGKERQVWFYKSSPGPRPNKSSRPFLIFGDGRETVEISRLPVILDNMVAAGELEPVCALFIAPLNRDGEYLGRDRKSNLEFLKDVLVPRLESASGLEHPLGGAPDRRILIGASNGGEFVTWAGALYPEFSTKIFNQSGVPGNEAGRGWLQDRSSSRVYTLVGSFERDFNRGGAESFHRTLSNNPSVVHRLKYLPQGHTWRMWGDGFRAGILWLLYGIDDPGTFPTVP